MPDTSSLSVAGIVLADRRHVFVSGAPADLVLDADVRVLLDGVEVRGWVSVPPDLLIWCDPTVPLAALLSVEASVACEAPLPASQPLALFLADATPPTERTLREILDLAARQADRLGG
jgi:hypothetical protein